MYQLECKDFECKIKPTCLFVDRCDVCKIAPCSICLLKCSCEDYKKLRGNKNESSLWSNS